MTFWTAGAGWYAQFYYDYCRYTGDRKFLKERALPFMREAAGLTGDLPRMAAGKSLSVHGFFIGSDLL